MAKGGTIRKTKAACYGRRGEKEERVKQMKTPNFAYGLAVFVYGFTCLTLGMACQRLIFALAGII